MAATTGLPQVSSLRSVALIDWMFSKISSESAGVACVMSLRSPPAKNVFLPEDTMTPLIESPSAAISSTSWLTAFSIESRYAWFMVLLLCDGSSMTRLTIPSAFS